MKKLILLALVLVSASAMAVECETNMYLKADASEVVIELTEKVKAEPDSEIFESVFGSKREQTDCKELEVQLEARNLRTDFEGTEIPVRIVNLSEKPKLNLLND